MAVNYVKISPLARVGGHLGVTTRINSSGSVTNAYCHGEAFRGIEKLILKRDPRDAPVITSRTCGKCHFTNRHVSLRNIETAAGFSFPFAQAADATYNATSGIIDDGEQPGYGDNELWHGPGRTFQGVGSWSMGTKMPVAAQLSRNIVQALTYIYSHLVHSVMLVGPDYKNLIDKFVMKFSSGSEAFDDSTWKDIVFTLSDGPQTVVGTESSDGFFDNFYKEALVAQRILHEMLGFFGGKAPHTMSAIPGGFSRSFEGDSTVTNGDMDAILTLATKYIGHGGADPNSTSDRWQLFDQADFDYLTNLTNSGDSSWIAARASLFILGLAWAAEQVNAHNWGIGPGNFVCAGAFDICDVSGSSDWTVLGDQYFRAGVYISTSGAPNGTGRYKLDCTTDTPSGDGWMTIYEDIASARYPEPDPVIDNKPQCAGYPGDTETHPVVGTPADRYVYTWEKSARVKANNGKIFPVEAGPLARHVVNGVDPDLFLDLGGLRKALYGSSWASSTANRLLARLQDMLLCIDILVGTNYSGERDTDKYLADIYNNFDSQGGSLLARLDHVLTNSSGAIADDELYTDPTYNWSTMGAADTPKEGAAFLDAPSGITCHFCKVENGKLTQYQQVAGTTWNGSGRDEYGNPGPFEWSLVGMQKKDADYGDDMDPTTTTNYDFDDSNAGSGEYVITTEQNKPLVERVLRISYQLREGNSWPTYYAYDEPKYDGDDKGKIVGPGLKETSEVDYNSGKITLEFKQSYDWGYEHIKNVKLDRYGWAANPVPAPATWDDTGYEGHSGDTDKPNPINIMRTVRSFDPCNNCGVH
ncbi:MAG: nickel-dependent hydrogenase large subunit [Archaeoglobaceae archaeon]